MGNHARASNDDVARLRPVADDAGFAAFYGEEYRPLLALALGLSATRAEAEERVHDAFAVAYRSWSRVGFLESPGGWTRRVLLNQLASAHRRRGRERRLLTRVAGRTPVEAPGSGDPDPELWAAVRALPTRQSQAIALHYVEDRSVEEIAEILELTVSSVKTHLQRGRRALAQALGGDDVQEVSS